MDTSYGAAMANRGRGSSTFIMNAGNFTWCPGLDYLADGVTSSVYRCREKTSGDFYAVKVFKTRPPQRELDVLQKLDHKNIVRLITEVQFKDEVGSPKTGLVLEYCSGNSLHEYLKKPSNKLGLHDSDFLTLLYNMCDGLAYLRVEQLKIVHRDIKPGNIMISYDSKRQPIFKLADFGSSRELPDDGDFQSLVGTYEFLHPSIYTEVYNRMHGLVQREIAAGHKPECDLWSLGVTLYMAATGRLPFSPFEGVRCNHAQMIEMMVKKPAWAISATQESPNGPVKYQDTLPATCQLSERLQTLLVALLQGILVCDFKEQWTFAKFFDTVNVDKSQYPTYYFMAGCMLRPNLVFSARQTLDSLLTSLSATTGYARDEIVVFYRSQVVSAFPTGSSHTSPVIVLSKQRFACTLEMSKLDFSFVKNRPPKPDQGQLKEVKDYIDEAHKQALACRQLARTCHLNHALTLEAKDAVLSLMRSRGRESYQRASAKVAMVSSTQQKVGRLMELAKLIGAQTKNQPLREQIVDWQRCVENAGARLQDFRPEGRDSMDSGSSSGCGSLVMADELASRFEALFTGLTAPRVEAECMSGAFYRVEQVHDRYGHMIAKYAQKDSGQLSDLMHRSFQFDRPLLDRCLDECQKVARECCVETLTSVRTKLADWFGVVQDEVTRLGKLESCLVQDTEAELDMLHDTIYTSINEALKIYFNSRNLNKEADISTLTKSIQELIRSTDLVQTELEQNTRLLRDLDEIGLRNSGLSSLDADASIGSG